MIKKLFFMAALLVPGLAYAANPSADLSGQIVPADPGLPAPAAAAGFTNLLLNADFTSPAWSNTANYIVNCGAADSVPNQPSNWHWRFTPHISTVLLPCSYTTITSDPAFSVPQVLNIHVPVAAWSSSVQQMQFTVPGIYAQGNRTDWFPNEVYAEITWRTNLTSWSQSNQYLDWWFPSFRGAPYPCCWLDDDWMEVINGNQGPNGANPQWGGGLTNWGDGQSPFGPVTYFNVDMTQYHTLGVLVTSDENTNVWKCTWIDSSFKGCINMAMREQENYLAHDNSLIHEMGSFGNNVVPTTDVDTWIKSIKIWSCPNAATQTCPGTMVTHWPFP